MGRTSLLEVQRLDDEYAGTLVSDVHVAGIRGATDEYNLGRKAASR